MIVEMGPKLYLVPKAPLLLPLWMLNYPASAATLKSQALFDARRIS